MNTNTSLRIEKDLLALREDWLKNPDYDCFWSSPNNKLGLRLTPKIEPGKLSVEMTIEKHHSGFPGISHGGIPFTVLDGMMSWYLMAHYGRAGFTVGANISYSRPLFVGETYRFEVVRDTSSSPNSKTISLKGQVFALGQTEDTSRLVLMTAEFFLPDKSQAVRVLGKKTVEAAKDIFPEA